MQDIDFGASKSGLPLMLRVTSAAIVKPPGYSPLQALALYQDASYEKAGPAAPAAGRKATKHENRDINAFAVAIKAPNSGLVLRRRGARLALAPIVFACTRRRAGRRSGAILRLRHRDHTAVRAHPDRIKPTIGRLVHPVLAGEGGGDALDRTFHAERLAAANAGERLLLLEHLRHHGGGAEVKLRPQRDHLLGAGCFAQPALHADILDKAQHRPVRIVLERACRTGRYACQAQRTAIHVDFHPAVRRAPAPRDDLGGAPPPARPCPDHAPD